MVQNGSGRLVSQRVKTVQWDYSNKPSICTRGPLLAFILAFNILEFTGKTRKIRPYSWPIPEYYWSDQKITGFDQEGQVPASVPFSWLGFFNLSHIYFLLLSYPSTMFNIILICHGSWNSFLCVILQSGPSTQLFFYFLRFCIAYRLVLLNFIITKSNFNVLYL